jgi:hypothetical protein
LISTRHHRSSRREVLISVGLLGLLSSLDPLRPMVFVLLLRTNRGRLNAIGFFAGWAIALAALFTLAFVVFNSGDAGRPSHPQKTWLSAIELALGALLLALALRRWRRRADTATHRGAPAPVQRQLERLTPRRSSFLGVLIQPRTLTIAAAVVVARERSGFADAAAGLGVFALLSTGALLGLFTYFVRRPDEADSWLAEVSARIEAAGPMLFTIACVIGGGYLLVQGATGFTT